MSTGKRKRDDEGLGAAAPGGSALAAADDALCAEIAVAQRENRAVQQRAQRLVDTAVACVQSAARAKWGWAEVFAFGSSATGLATGCSDVDLSVHIEAPALTSADGSSEEDRRKQRNFGQARVKQFAAAMKRDGRFVAAEAVHTARVPVVRVMLAVGGAIIQCVSALPSPPSSVSRAAKPPAE